MKIMKPILLICVSGGVVWRGGFTRADLIADWNKTASDYLVQNAVNHYDRGMTMVHVAQFDVVNAVSGGYVPYLLNVSAPGASPEAAAAQAAYTILTNISRANISTLNNALQKSLANIPPGRGKDDGLQLGQAGGSRVHSIACRGESRSGDYAADQHGRGKVEDHAAQFSAGNWSQLSLHASLDDAEHVAISPRSAARAFE